MKVSNILLIYVFAVFAAPIDGYLLPKVQTDGVNSLLELEVGSRTEVAVHGSRVPRGLFGSCFGACRRKPNGASSGSGESQGPRPTGNGKPPKPTGQVQPPKPTGQVQPAKPTGHVNPPKPTGQSNPPKPTGQVQPPKPTGHNTNPGHSSPPKPGSASPTHTNQGKPLSNSPSLGRTGSLGRTSSSGKLTSQTSKRHGDEAPSKPNKPHVRFQEGEAGPTPGGGSPAKPALRKQGSFTGLPHGAKQPDEHGTPCKAKGKILPITQTNGNTYSCKCQGNLVLRHWQQEEVELTWYCTPKIVRVINGEPRKT